jgi:hypothetical protein
MEQITLVELGDLGRELSGLSAAASWAGQAAVLSRAGVLLEKLYAAPAVRPLVEAEDRAAQRWQAIRVAGDAGRVEILCWNQAESTQVRGHWRDGVQT